MGGVLLRDWLARERDLVLWLSDGLAADRRLRWRLVRVERGSDQQPDRDRGAGSCLERNIPALVEPIPINMSKPNRVELLSRYREGASVLAAAVARLSKTELDHKPADGGFSAREVVHHT